MTIVKPPVPDLKSLELSAERLLRGALSKGEGSKQPTEEEIRTVARVLARRAARQSKPPPKKD